MHGTVPVDQNCICFILLPIISLSLDHTLVYALVGRQSVVAHERRIAMNSEQVAIAREGTLDLSIMLSTVLVLLRYGGR